MKFKKFVSLLIVVLAILGISLLLSKNKIYFSNSHPKTNIETSTEPIQTNNPTPTVSEPEYSVKVVSSTVVNSEAPNDVTYKLIIKNYSIKPYITNFAFYQCDFVDNNGKLYEGSFMTETSLDKAIIPGESQTLSITSQANLDGYTGNVEGFKKCDFQQNGSKTCTIATNLKVKSCTAYTTSDGGQASNGWGSNPITINFLQ